jgi:hypothetical protein
LKSPLTATFVTVIALFELFVRVAVCEALVRPTCSVKESEAGERVSELTLAPVSETTWGLVAAGSVTVIVPATVPVAVGAKVTLIVQVPPLPGMDFPAQLSVSP